MGVRFTVNGCNAIFFHASLAQNQRFAEKCLKRANLPTVRRDQSAVADLHRK
jgi:hypothetical protein